MCYTVCAVESPGARKFLPHLSLKAESAILRPIMLADHPGEGHPVQRRVSYRRLTEEDSTEGDAGGDNLSVHQNHGGTLSKAGSMRGVAGTDSRDRRADTDPDFALVNNPTSLWHEIWLAVRCAA